MVNKKAVSTGAYLIQNDMPSVAFVNSPQDNARFQPITDDITVASFVNTHHPVESDDVEWKRVEINWIRSTTSPTPIFDGLFQIYGIMIDGEPELIGEYETTAISSTPVEGTIVFDLISSGGEPPVRKELSTITSGKIRLNLPMRLANYDTIQFERAWGDDNWPKRKQAVLTNYNNDILLNYPMGTYINYLSSMQSDFSDIRFYADGRIPLNYYIIKKTDSSGANVYFQVPEIKKYPEATLISCEYGNASATSQSNGFNVFTGFDDVGDGKYTGRNYPYVNWGWVNGTPAIESNAPISGSYSLKHTGNGSDIPNNCFIKTTIGTPLLTGFKFRLASQGSLTYTPYILLRILRYYNYQNWVRLDTYYDSVSGKQKLRLYKMENGTPSTLATIDWLTGKLGTATYWFEIWDTGTGIIVNIDGTTMINTSYTTTVPYGQHGFGANQDSAGIWDELYYYSPNLTVTQFPTKGAWNNEESQINNLINPDSWDDTLQYLDFTLPSDYLANTLACFNVTELDSSTYESPDVPISSTNVLRLGYDHVAKYHALRIVPQFTTDNNNSITINSIKYIYDPNI